MSRQSKKYTDSARNVVMHLRIWLLCNASSLSCLVLLCLIFALIHGTVVWGASLIMALVVFLLCVAAQITVIIDASLRLESTRDKLGNLVDLICTSIAPIHILAWLAAPIFLPATICWVPIGAFYLSTYFMDFYFTDKDKPVGLICRMATIYAIFLPLLWPVLAGLNVWSVVGLMFAPPLLLFVVCCLTIALKDSQYIDRTVYEPVNLQQNVVTYTFMQLILGCLATLDIDLLIQNPVDYVRQIFAHFKGAAMRPCYCIYDNFLSANAYSKVTWVDNNGVLGFLYSTGGRFKGEGKEEAQQFAEEYRGCSLANPISKAFTR